jgi:hypothetical protein
MRQRVENPTAYAFRVGQHLVVPEAQDSIALGAQELAAFGFRPCGRFVLTAVDLHNHTRLMAGEISDVPSERHLSPEFEARHSARVEQSPDLLLGFGHVPAQRSRPAKGASGGVLFHSCDFTPTLPSPIEGEGFCMLSRAAAPP